jgi:hypothetical protein
LAVETWLVIKVDSLAFGVLDRFNFVVNISEWGIRANLGVVTLIVALRIECNTCGCVCWEDGAIIGRWVFTFNDVDIVDNTFSRNEVPLLDVPLESSIVVIRFG